MVTGLSSKKLLKWSESSKEATVCVCARTSVCTHTHTYILYILIKICWL